MAKLSVSRVPPVGPTVPPEPLDELELPLLDELPLLELEEHAQGEEASPTHCVSQLVEQQYASPAQTVVTHTSHDDTSLAPAVQGEWLQVPLLDELEALEELEELVVDPPEAPVTGPPQTLVLGKQSLSFCPSASATGVQVRSDAQAVAAQLGAQY
jgi:hypothetical protein